MSALMQSSAMLSKPLVVRREGSGRTSAKFTFVQRSTPKRVAHPRVRTVCHSSSVERAAQEHSVDYYELIGERAKGPSHRFLRVKPDALSAEIKAAYRTAAKQCHPDKQGSDEMMTLLNKAYRVLSDINHRAMYDSGRVMFGGRSLFQDFTGLPLSKVNQSGCSGRTNALFVDETLCIGKQCTAPK
eukprot:1188680-Prorocentrum_minimum.AAC.4